MWHHFEGEGQTLSQEEKIDAGPHSSLSVNAIAIRIISVVAFAVIVIAITVFVRPGYDALYALSWGRDVAQGLGLDYTHPSSPTPHPLSVLGAIVVGPLPRELAVVMAGALSAVAAVALAIQVGALSRRTSGQKIVASASMAIVLVSAPVALLVLNASLDIAYAALGVGATLLAVRRQHRASVGVFLIAALLRPEAVLLALVPLWIEWRNARGSAAGGASSARTAAMFVGGLVVAVAAWIALGVAGGDALVALHSAAGNAELNNNPRGMGTAVTTLVSGLASPTSGVVLVAACLAVLMVMTARGLRGRLTSAARVSTAEADGRRQAVQTVASIAAVACLGYLGQGALGTPLVARYLLLPALLCLPLSAALIASTQIPRAERERAIANAVLALVLVATAVGANIPGWQDIVDAREARDVAFAGAEEMMDRDFVAVCADPLVVRSPAMVPVVAWHLDLPLSAVKVGAEPGEGVLLQPLTVDAALLAGFGPYTPLDEQAAFPSEAPPRANNEQWALYSRCVQ